MILSTSYPRARRRAARLALLLTVVLSGAAAGCRTHPLADRDEVAEEAIREYVEVGVDSIPELRELVESEDLLIRSRAKRALGRITGQWGSLGDGIHWHRSFDAALNQDRPILLLHLFGRFDEEFC